MTDPLPLDAASPSELDELNCPLCGYSLRGLPEPRCPECGYQFEWNSLLTEMRRREAWFFEHAQTRSSHLATRWRSLRPRKFWADINPAWMINVYQLRVYLIATIIATTATYFLFCWGTPLASDTFYHFWNWLSPPPVIRTGPLMTTYVPPVVYFGERDRFFIPFLVLCGLMSVCVFSLTHVFWLVLSFSTHQRAILPQQLFRATVYVLDVIPWITLGQMAAFYIAWREDWWHWSYAVTGSSSSPPLGLVFFTLALLCLAVIAYRMGVVSRKYLKLPHAPLIAIVYFLIIGLTWMTAALYVAEFARI